MTLRHESASLRYAPFVCASAFFAFMTYLYVYIMPVAPWNGDDWVYLSQFRDMFPSLTRANPARILPEVLHPLVGLAASVIYAFSGNYLDALVWCHALLMAAAVTALAVALYWALRAVLRDGPLALFASMLFMALAFSLFKSRAQGNIFVLFSDCLTVTTFYVVPNVLNSILACYILHGHVTGTRLRPASLGAGCLMLLIFLAQFSMTFGSAIAAVFAGWVCLWRLLRQPAGTLWGKIAVYARSGTFFDASLLCIMAFWVLAAILDTLGGRYGKIQQRQWDFAAAWQGFVSVWSQVHLTALVVVCVVLAAALLRFAYKRLRRRWDATDGLFAGMLLVCVLSAGALLGMDVAIAARTFPLTAAVHVSYNVFFCGLLGVTVCACYLLRSMPRLKLVAPLVLALLLVECLNSEKPWRAQPAADRAVVEQWLVDVRAAAQRGESAVAITVPKAEWPHPKEWFGKALAQTLFAHGVTRQRMDITLREATP